MLTLCSVFSFLCLSFFSDNSHPVSSIYLFHGSTPLSPVPVLYPSLSIPGSSITKESTSSASWGSRDSNLGFSTAAQNGSRSFGCSYSPSGVGKSSNRIRGNYEANGGNEALMAHINELERERWEWERSIGLSLR